MDKNRRREIVGKNSTLWNWDYWPKEAEIPVKVKKKK